MLSEAITEESIRIQTDGIEPIFALQGPHFEAAIGVMTLAFSTDPVARWMYPDPSDYLLYFPDLIRAFAGRSFEKGTAYLAPNAAGAALWLPPGVEPDRDELIGLIWSSTSDSVQHDLFPIFDKMVEFHPQEPHWYLPMIGVDTGRQGIGVGSALLQNFLANCDAREIPAYLESSNPRNIPLYQRFGFEVTGTIEIGDAPPLFPMVRRPQRAWDEDLLITKS